MRHENLLSKAWMFWVTRRRASNTPCEAALQYSRNLGSYLGETAPLAEQLFIFKDFIYLFMRDAERERGRDTGGGRSRLHARTPTGGTRSRVSQQNNSYSERGPAAGTLLEHIPQRRFSHTEHKLKNNNSAQCNLSPLDDLLATLKCCAVSDRQAWPHLLLNGAEIQMVLMDSVEPVVIL